MKAKIFMMLMIAVLSSSCSILGQTIVGSGNVKSETRQVNGVKTVQLNGIGDVNIVLGTSEACVVEAEDNIINYLTTENNNGNFKIGIQEGYNLQPTKDIRYTLIVTNLNSLVLNGSGNIRADNTANSDMNIQINGSGNITVSGTTGYLAACINGSGNIYASGLKTQNASVNIRGSGNASVWVLQSLNANISGSGNIDYYGSPYVSSSVSGTGKVRYQGNK